MTYNIVDFGAKVSDLLQTDSIQAAIDTCFKNGGGEVVVPAGIFRTGGLRLRSHVTLHLLSGAILEASEDWDDYDILERDPIEPVSPDPDAMGTGSGNMLSPWQHAVIRAAYATDVSVIGDPYSYIDGRNCYDPNGENSYRGPHGINMWHCENITLRGYTIRNTGNWAHAIFRSRNITAENITVYGGHDGIDFFLCREATVSLCHFYTGDDCLAGFGNENITARDCVLNTSCSAIRMGGANMLFERCRTDAPPKFAFRGSLPDGKKAQGAMTDATCRRNTRTAFLYYCDRRFGDLDFPQPGNIVIRDCSFDQVDQLFNMAFGKHKWCYHRPLASITFENCTLTGAVLPINLCGDAHMPTAFTLKRVTVSPNSDHKDDPFMDAEFFTCLTLQDVTIPGYTDPRIIVRSDGTIESERTDSFTIQKGTPGGSALEGH